MKKKILSILLAIMICFSLVQVFSPSKISSENYNYTQFCNKVALACENDDFIETNNSNFGLKRLIVKGKFSETYGASEVINGYRDYSVLCYNSESETERAYNLLKQDKSISVSVDTVFTSEGYAENDYSNYYSNNYCENKYQNSNFKNRWGSKAIDNAGYIDFLSNNLLANNPAYETVVVVVIDTGVKTTHEMLANRFLYEKNENNEDRIVGASFINSSNYALTNYQFEDDEGHGSHVTGIIVDNTPENVKILPIRALGTNGKGTLTSIIGAIAMVETYASTYNIACVNLSLGADTFDDETVAQCEDLFVSLKNRGILSVVAAGNSSTNTSNILPACCETPIVVSALKNNEDVNNSLSSSRAKKQIYEFDCSYSNYGSNIDISAPGSQIYSAVIDNKIYDLKSGTSMATPFVSSAITLVYLHKINLESFSSFNESLSSEIETKIKSMAVDLGDNGKDDYYGYGMVYLKYFELEKSNVTLSLYNHSQTTPLSLDETNCFEFSKNISVRATASSSDYKIFYTTDGTIPTKKSNKYSSEISLKNNTRLTLIAIKLDESNNVIQTSDVYSTIFANTATSFSECFSINMQKGTIIGYFGSFKSIVIPSVINYYGTNVTITGIGESAFYACDTIVSIELPSTCTEIMKNAFNFCKNLKQVSMPEVTKIGENAFLNCVKLTSVSAKKVTTISDKAFCGAGLMKICPSSEQTGENVANFDALSTAGHNCFAENRNLTYVSLNNLKNKNILNYFNNSSDSLFENCVKLSECHLNNVYGISNSQFKNCVSLENFFIGKDVKYIDQNAFFGAGLKQIFVDEDSSYYYSDGNGLYDYSKNTFLGLFPYKNISYQVKSSVNVKGTDYPITKLDDYVLSNHVIYELTIPESIIVIGKNCFKNSTIDKLILKAENLTYDGYYRETIGTSGETVIDFKQIFENTNIDNFIVDDSVNLIPKYFFYGVNINNIYINADIDFDTDSLININANTLYINYVGVTTFNSFKTKYGQFLFTIDKIYSKSQFNTNGFTFNTEKQYYYNSYKSGYYFYSTISGEKPNLPLTVTGFVGTYDGTYHNLGISANGAGNLTIVYGESAGHYTISNYANSLLFKNATNGMIKVYFKVVASGYADTEGYGYLQIDKANVTIKINNKSDTYGNVHSISDVGYTRVSVNIFGSDEIKINKSFDAEQFSPIGDYEISGTLDSSVINYNVEIRSGVFTIEPRSLMIIINNVQQTYGELELSNDSYSISSGTVVNNDNLGITLVYGTDTFNAGEYTIDLEYTNSNYSILYQRAFLTILKREIVIDINDSETFYGDNELLSGYEIISGSFVNNDESACNFTIDSDVNNLTDIGTYPITGSYNTLRNYNLTVYNGEYTVKKREVTITLDDSSSTYGEDILLDDFFYKITSGNFVNGDFSRFEINISTTAEKTSGHGTYPVSCTFNQSDFTNYDITIINGNYVINKRNITFKIFNAESIYGEEIVLGGFEIESGEFVFEDEALCEFQIACSVQPNSNVGRYAITGSYNTDNMVNYNINIRRGTYTLKAREILINVKSGEGTYGNNIVINNNYYDIVSGTFVYEDKQKFNPTISTTANNKSNVGEYEITATFEPVANYNIVISSGTYIIKKRNLELTLRKQTGIYGSNFRFTSSYDVTGGDIVNNDNIVVTEMAYNSLNKPISSHTTVGEYLLTGTCNEKNYNITIIDSTFEILKKKITIKLLNQTTPHWGKLELKQDAFEIVDNTAINEEMNIKISAEDFDRLKTFWGELELTATYDNYNYDITFINAKVTVEISIYDGIAGAVILFIFVFTLYKIASKPKIKLKKKSSSSKSSGAPKRYV